jgi:hypothetical protein
MPRASHSPSALFKVAFVLVLGAGHGLAQTTGTTNLSVTVSAEASITVNTGTTSLTPVTTFANYAGTTAFTYKVRTSASTGSGNIELEVTSDFTPTNGPSVGSPPTAGDKLTYTCTVAAPGTACTGTQTASISAQTPVATFGAAAYSNVAGNAGSVAWILTNDPVYKPNTYTAVVTLTISAT